MVTGLFAGGSEELGSCCERITKCLLTDRKKVPTTYVQGAPEQIACHVCCVAHTPQADTLKKVENLIFPQMFWHFVCVCVFRYILKLLKNVLDLAKLKVLYAFFLSRMYRFKYMCICVSMMHVFNTKATNCHQM